MRPTRFVVRMRDAGAFTAVGGAMIDLVEIHNPSTSPDWTPLTSLFDLYRVSKIIVRYFPRLTQASLSNSLAVSFSPIYVLYDPDSATAISTADQAISYTNMKAYNLYQPWSFTVNNPHVRNTATSGLGAASVTFDPVHGMLLDVGSAVNNTSGIVSWYADGISTPSGMNDSLGELLVEWHLDMFVRR
jgi:hypothetical protein